MLGVAVRPLFPQQRNVALKFNFAALVFNASRCAAWKEEVSVYTLLHCFPHSLYVSLQVQKRQTLTQDVLKCHVARNSKSRLLLPIPSTFWFSFVLVCSRFVFFHPYRAFFAAERFLSINTGRLCLARPQWCNTCNHFVLQLHICTVVFFD